MHPSGNIAKLSNNLETSSTQKSQCEHSVVNGWRALSACRTARGHAAVTRPKGDVDGEKQAGARLPPLLPCQPVLLGLRMGCPVDHRADSESRRDVWVTQL